MATAKQISEQLDIICSHIEQALRLSGGAGKYQRLAQLHSAEVVCWQAIVESSQSRITWLAAMAAVERARSLSQYWSRRGRDTGEAVAA